MKCCCVAIAFLVAFPAMAASVEWGAFALCETGSETLAIGYVGKEVYATSSIQIRTTPKGDRLGIEETGTYLAAFTAWAVASAGEIVNAGLLSDTSRLFFRNDGIQASRPFDVNYASDSFYLAFETLVWDNEEMSGTPQTVYGWVGVDVTAGQLSIVDSAMGLHGQSMTVGGGSVPEPASELLTMLGLAALVLRRSRTAPDA